MITRVFMVRVFENLQQEFETDFETLSIIEVKSSAGLISVEIFKPAKWSPREYLMISKWKNEDALIAFVGENWNEAIIPDPMKKYAEFVAVQHFVSWDQSTTPPQF